MKLIHTCIRVYDLERSIDFYVNKLGFELKRKFELPGADATLAYVSPPGQEYEIELTYNHGRDFAYTIGNGYAHMALQPPGKIGSGTRIAFAMDPDGYNLELIGRK
jgi:catechol 2,3-dioxygenase-like lactoylglutathione lyase family enzyme